MKKLIKKNAIISYFGKGIYVANIPQIKGLIVEGTSRKEVKKELKKSLLVKFAYDYDLKL